MSNLAFNLAEKRFKNDLASRFVLKNKQNPLTAYRPRKQGDNGYYLVLVIVVNQAFKRNQTTPHPAAT